MTAPKTDHEPMRRYGKDDVDREILSGMKIAILGYGSQGRAHALNIRDSGYEVIVGARAGGPSWQQAKEDGFVVLPMSEAAKQGRLIALTAPDMAHGEIFAEHIAENLQSGDALLFAHGFSIVYGEVKPPDNIDVIMVAPKGPGAMVRRAFEQGSGLPCLFCVHQDASGKAAARALAYGDAIGSTRVGAFQTSFRQETETDLFGEQTVLCGGAKDLAVMGYETLVEAGYHPEMAYYECLHELKLVVDLLHEGGLAKMHEFVSETAAYGGLVAGPRLVNETTRAQMRAILKEIQSGDFAKKWIAENRTGKKQYRQMVEDELAHDIEAIGARVRKRMASKES